MDSFTVYSTGSSSAPMDAHATLPEAQAVAIGRVRHPGDKVSRTVTATRTPRRLAGKRHERCLDHHKLAGYLTPVCLLAGQDAEGVLSFARDVLAIAAGAGDVLSAARLRDFGRQAVAA